MPLKRFLFKTILKTRRHATDGLCQKKVNVKKVVCYSSLKGYSIILCQKKNKDLLHTTPHWASKRQT